MDTKAWNMEAYSRENSEGKMGNEKESFWLMKAVFGKKDGTSCDNEINSWQ